MIIISTAAASRVRLSDDQKALVRPWESFCHDKKVRQFALYVDYSAIRDTSRWKCAKRERPFVVRSASTLDVLTSSKTFEGAMKLAAKMAKDRHPSRGASATPTTRQTR